MDISKFDVTGNAEKGARLFFTNPYNEVEKELIGAYMDVLGADSKAYRKVIREQQLSIMNSKTEDESKKKLTMEQLDTIEANNISALVTIVTGVGDTDINPDTKEEKDYIEDDGEKLKFNKKNVKHLLTKYSWMRDQIIGFINKRSNFLA